MSKIHKQPVPQPSAPVIKKAIEIAAQTLGDLATIPAAFADAFHAGATVATTRGINVGAQGDNDPVVPAARKQAKDVASTKVDWAHPDQTLNRMSQFGATNDNDSVRCGAAVLVAGAVLEGPKQFKAGLDALTTRGSDVAAKYGDMAQGAHDQADKVRAKNPQLADKLDAFANAAERMENDVDGATNILEKYAGKDPKSLTQGDLEKIQGAVYIVANADQRIVNDQSFDPSTEQKMSYLSVDAMQTYSQLMWGKNPPQLDGKDLSTMRVENGQGGAHFVLAGSDGKVGYNPWPEKDGTAYVRTTDGDGAKVVAKGAAAGELNGATVKSYGKSLPDRS